jgi:predicted AlkP superfamily pyrophosphatase or phosphodiesterase
LQETSKCRCEIEVSVGLRDDRRRERARAGGTRRVLALAAAGSAVAATADTARAAEHVIHVSVDGLRTGDATQNLQTLIETGKAPTFARLQREAAWTHDARTDTKYVYTLPNHTSMMTGRPADDEYGPKTGHQYRYNTDPEDDPIPNNNLHENAAFFTLDPNIYIASAFDVAHDNGLRTALYTGKDKFVVFDNSWDADSGRPDATGADNGRDKIDVYRNSDDRIDGVNDTPALVTHLLGEMTGPQPLNYSFLHLEDPDAAGHATAWGSPEYLAAIELVDEQLGRILDAIESDPTSRGAPR